MGEAVTSCIPRERDEIGSAYAMAYDKLRALEDAGRVTSRKVGNARLWTVDGEVDE